MKRNTQKVVADKFETNHHVFHLEADNFLSLHSKP